MYTTIIHPIRNSFNLSLNEYCVLDTIYHLSNNQRYNGWCVASKGHIAKVLGLGESTVYTILTTLEEKGLIERSDRGDVRTLDLWNELIANKDDYIIGFTGKESQFLTGNMLKKAKKAMPTPKGRDTLQNQEGGLQNLEGDTPESGYNNNNYNNNDNIVSKDTKAATPPIKYGNENINKILIALKETIGIDAFADSRIERNIGKHIANLLEKIGSEEFRRRLDFVLNDDFRRKNCNRIKYLYGELKSVPTKNIKPNTLVL